MKKATLIAMMALAASAASAQYSVDPTTETTLKAGKVTSVQYLQLDATSIAAFEKQGATVTNWAPDELTRFLYIWDETFTAGDSSYPGVGLHFDGYPSVVVAANTTWSGAGFNVNGISTENWNDETRFHLAYMSPGAACPSVALVIADGEKIGSNPAKISLGTAFNDNGAVFPAVAPACTDDWQGIDISFKDLAKLYPTFNYKRTDNWEGNMLSFLCGGVQGQTFSIDAIYFYNLAEAGIADATTDANWTVTSRTINVNGAQGIELYDLTGKCIKTTNGAVLGIEELPAGVYVARSGNSARKIVK